VDLLEQNIAVVSSFSKGAENILKWERRREYVDL